MIVHYRIPLISKNVRTMCSKISKKILQLDDNNQIDYFEGETTRPRRLYRILNFDQNVRVLMIQDPWTDKSKTFFSTRIGIGNGYDTDDCHGLAHLLEHAIINIFNNYADNITLTGETHENKTVYSLGTETDEFLDITGEFLNLLFCPHATLLQVHDIQRIVATEIKRVNEEFYGKHRDVPLGKRLQQILRERAIIMPNFGTGTSKTLMGIPLLHLIQKLEELRLYYRHRQVLICTYGSSSLPLKDFYEKWKSTSSTPVAPLTPAHTVEMNFNQRCKNADLSEFLHLIKSESDSLQLVLYFPFKKRCELNEQRTVEVFCDLYTLVGQEALVDYLLEKKLATGCHYHIPNNDIDLLLTIDLTMHGLKNIKTVVGACFKYLEFLVHKWTTFDEYKKRFLRTQSAQLGEESGLYYTEFIATHFDTRNDKFDEMDLLRTCNKAEEQLLAENITKNENVVYLIVTRNIENVKNVLAANNTVKEEAKGRETYYNIDYSVYRTDLFKNRVQMAINFNILNEENHKIPAFVTQPKDTVYQELCYAYVIWKSCRFVAYFKRQGIGDFDVTANGIFYGSLTKGLCPDVRDHFNELKPFDMDDDDFEVTKNKLMYGLSKEMTNSKELARSLMRTAIYNLHHRIKKDPAPNLYNNLKKMDKKNYIAHFQQIHKNKNHLQNAINNMENDDIQETDMFQEDLIIKSIDKTELSTVTYDVYIVEARYYQKMDLIDTIWESLKQMAKKLELYTFDCNLVSFNGVDGIALTAVTVESDKNQHSGDIRSEFDKIIEELPLHLKCNDLKKIHQVTMHRAVRIQIVGHEKSKDNAETFEADFDKWFQDHKQKFERLSHIGRS